MATVTTKKKKPSKKTIPTGKGLTFEKVWAMMQETDRQMKENAEQFKQEMKERDERFEREKKENTERFEREKKETEKQMKENAERFDREMKKSAKRLNKQLGELGGRYGEMIESMVVPNLVKKFRKLGFVFEKAYKDAEIKDETNSIFTEVDITLENGDKVMIVEVKSKPKTEDVTEHIERMEKVKRHAGLHGDKRKYLGAVAGMIFSDNVKEFAMKSGFYVIEPSGETFIITAPEGIYSPREW